MLSRFKSEITPLTETKSETDKTTGIIYQSENIKGNKLAQELASSGFRDTTRLALSNLQMATDMVEMNGENISEALSSLQDCLQNLLSDIYHEKVKEIKVMEQSK